MLRAVRAYRDVRIPSPVGQLAVRDFDGGGLPLVIAHGFGENLVSWGPVADRLAGRRVVTFDQPSHGHSDPTDDLDHASVAGALGAVVEELGLGEHVVAGHSWGALVGIVHASTTRLCRGLVCLDQALFDHAPTRFARTLERALAERTVPLEGATAEEFEGFLADAGHLGTLREEFHRRACHIVGGWVEPRPAGRHLVWLERLEDHAQPVEHYYRTVTCPIRWVLSATSPNSLAFAPPGSRAELLQALLARHPHLRADICGVDAGHLMHIEAPGEVARALGSFLDTQVVAFEV